MEWKSVVWGIGDEVIKVPMEEDWAELSMRIGIEPVMRSTEIIPK
jgi:hypothetical protein